MNAEHLKNYPYLREYLIAWDDCDNSLATPLIILIGGYAGTGKSTVANNIRQLIPNINVVATGIARSTAQAYLNEEENPYLYAHTYELDTVTVPSGKRMMESLIGRFDKKILEIAAQNDDDSLTLKEKYLLQINAVQKGLLKAVDFAATECQHWVLDGNHVFPGLTNRDEKAPAVVIAEWYMKVTDPTVHHKMLGGKTHKRNLTSGQFDNARVLHDFTVQAAELTNKNIFEYTVNPVAYLSLIEKAVKEATI